MIFLISSLVTGVAFGMVMLTGLKLTQDLFHPERSSRLAGANTIVQSGLDCGRDQPRRPDGFSMSFRTATPHFRFPWPATWCSHPTGS
jgi:hypothetical protein